MPNYAKIQFLFRTRVAKISLLKYCMLLLIGWRYNLVRVDCCFKIVTYSFIVCYYCILVL